MTRRFRPSRFFVPLCVALVGLLTSCGSIPKTSITEIPDAPPLNHPNDSLYAHVLERAVLPGGAVNVGLLQSDTELTAYLRDIAVTRIDVFTSRQQLLAFWINAHNAYVLDLLRSNQPLASIGDLSGFKSTHVVMIGGKRYSLGEIEDYVLTHDFREPRAFFALFDGSKSSPDLRNAPYGEAALSDQLDDQVFELLADTTKNFLDAKSNKLYLSHVFQHYQEEMDKWVGGTLRFVREFAPDKMAAWIDRHPNVELAYLRTDETLNATPAERHNDQPTPKPKRPRRKASGGVE